MNFGGYELQIFVSVLVILGCAFVALLVDYLKGANEKLRESHVDLLARQETLTAHATEDTTKILSALTEQTSALREMMERPIQVTASPLPTPRLALRDIPVREIPAPRRESSQGTVAEFEKVKVAMVPEERVASTAGVAAPGVAAPETAAPALPEVAARAAASAHGREDGRDEGREEVLPPNVIRMRLLTGFNRSEPKVETAMMPIPQTVTAPEVVPDEPIFESAIAEAAPAAEMVADAVIEQPVAEAPIVEEAAMEEVAMDDTALEEVVIEDTAAIEVEMPVAVMSEPAISESVAPESVAPESEVFEPVAMEAEAPELEAPEWVEAPAEEVAILETAEPLVVASEELASTDVEATVEVESLQAIEAVAEMASPVETPAAEMEEPSTVEMASIEIATLSEAISDQPLGIPEATSEATAEATLEAVAEPTAEEAPAAPEQPDFDRFLDDLVAEFDNNPGIYSSPEPAFDAPSMLSNPEPVATMSAEPVLPQLGLIPDSSLLESETSNVEEFTPNLELPAGTHSAAVLEEYCGRREPMNGLVVSIGINEFGQIHENLGRAAAEELLRTVDGLMASLAGNDGFCCRLRDDEFVLAFSRLSGPNAQRRLSELSERLWDFQLRNLGTFSVVFSWGAHEAQRQSLTDSIALATERMKETQTSRRSVSADRGRRRRATA